MTSSAPDRRRWWQTALAIAISAGFLYWALKGIHFSEVMAELEKVRVLPLIACVLIATSTFGFRIFRWRILLRAEDGSPLPAAALWHAIAIGFMANNVLPFRAGEVLRSIAITRLTRTRITSALSSIAAERLFDGVALVLVLVFGLLWSGLPSSTAIGDVRVTHIAVVAGAAFLSGLVVAGLVVAFPGPAERLILKVIPFRRLATRLVAMIEGVVHGLSVVKSPVRMTAVILWSLVIWLVSVSSFYVAFQAFDIPVNFAGAMLMQGILAFAITAPTAPGFVGIFESAIKASLLLYGIDENVAVTYALVYHATTFVPITLLGAWSLMTTGLGLKNLQREAAPREPLPRLMIRIQCHAKVNLFLRVLAREASGYHSIETLFCRLNLADDLAVERREGHDVSINTNGTDLGPDADNLAVRAAAAVIEATGRRFGAHLDLAKNIPARAGLGGGSSNAAAALVAVNQLAGNAIPRHELLQLAAKLGSDVPFFLSGGPLALGWGHGERLMRLPPLPVAPALLLIPPVGVATAEAYRWVDQARIDGGHRGAVALDLEALSTWGNIGRMAGNEFESVVFGKHPEIRAAFEGLAATHPLLCRMSGTGSALVAVYRNARERDDAKLMLLPRLGKVIVTETMAMEPA